MLSTNNWTERAFKTFDQVFLESRANKSWVFFKMKDLKLDLIFKFIEHIDLYSSLPMNGLSITENGKTEKKNLTEKHLRRQVWPIRFGIVVRGFKSMNI